MSKNHREIGASLLLIHAHDTQVDIDGGTGTEDDVVVVEAYRACAALLTDEAEADRALGTVWRRFFQSISDVEREEFYTLVASHLTGEAADLINELDAIAVDLPECDAIADALREEGGQ